MTDTTKNTLLAAMAVVTVAALVFAFNVPTKKPAPQHLTYAQATAAKNQLESLKTDKEKISYLNSTFPSAVKNNSSSVSLSTSKAGADWCAYADYYLNKAREAMSAGDNDLADAYISAAIEMGDNCTAGAN
jgi:hypothetical protein